MRALIKKFLASGVFRQLIRLRLGRRILRLVPRRISYHLMSGLTEEMILTSKVVGLEIDLISSSDDDYFRKLYRNGDGALESEVLSVWAQLSEGSNVVVDVGAYVGLFSIVAARKGVLSVIAFEPNGWARNRAMRNAEQNQVSGSIEFRNIALSDADGVEALVSPKNRQLSSGTRLARVALEQGRSGWGESEVVELRKLDSELTEDQQRSVSCIKIDVEGHELAVLKGAEETILKSHPTLLVECLTKRKLDEVETFLAFFGYGSALLVGCESPTADQQAADRPSSTNFLFRYESG